MIVVIVVSCILVILVIALLYLLNKMTREKEFHEKQDKRNWTLKVALEKTFKLPTVEAKELESIESQIKKIMNESVGDEEVEEKMRLAIMELYASKYERKDKKE
jgi:Na+-transporting NADH:ubiquinone oxidoreductase subunit NqrC